MDSKCAYCKYYMNNMCKGIDKIFPCKIWTANDDKPTSFRQLMRWKFGGSSIKPKGRKQWFKLGYDIFLMCFFLFWIYNSIWIYNHGYEVGCNNCVVEYRRDFLGINASINISNENFTGILGEGMMSPPEYTPT